MSIFIKKKKGNLEENGYSGKPPDYFREVVGKRKIKIAGWLNQKTEGYSSFQKKTALVIFCILFGVMSLYILAGSVHGHNFNTRSLIITHIRSGMPPFPAPTITDSVFRQAEKTKYWLDSLRVNDTMKFKAILLSKPYLLNNLQLIENIYKSQFK